MTTPATAIEKLRRLLEASTPGRWYCSDGEREAFSVRCATTGYLGPVHICEITAHHEKGQAHAEFIAAAHNTLPLLFAELDRLRRFEESDKLHGSPGAHGPLCADEIARLRGELDRLREACLHRDNGYEKCRLCKGWAHMGEPVQHDKECPLKETTTDDQRS